MNRWTWTATFIMVLCGLGSAFTLGQMYQRRSHHCVVPRLQDGIFIWTNGLVFSIDNGQERGIAAEATNCVIRTRRGTIVTSEFTPLIVK